MRKPGLMIVALSMALLTGCVKNDNSNNNNNNGCNKPATPTVTAPSPLNAGDAITLSTAAVTNGKYSWTGPGGWTSTDQNPVINNAVPSMTGTYSVTVTVGSCTSDAGSANVVVNTVSQPCTINDNTTEIVSPTSGTIDLTLNGYCIDANGAYEVTGSDSNGNYGLIAHFKSAPAKDGIYSVTELASPNANEVYLTAQNVKNNHNYHSMGGLAWVKVNGSSVSISFCQVAFSNPAFSNDFLTVTANMKCQ